MNMHDLKIEALPSKLNGMQPVINDNGVRVTHLPTGLVVEVPHGFNTSQNRNIKTAIAMLETVLPKSNQNEKNEKTGE